MKKITTQAELDALREVKQGEEVIIESSQELTLNFNISVYGVLKIYSKIKMSWSSRYVEAWGNSNVVAWGNSNVVAWGNSNVEARENSNVVARENSNVEAWGNSNVVARGNSNVVAWENSSIKLNAAYSLGVKVKLFGFSVCWKPFDKNFDVQVKSKTALIQEFKNEKYLEREGIEVVKNKVVLYKRVSSDYKTQENTKNETTWIVGKTLEHANWNPTSGECGEGKYHACSRPYFCDEFRGNASDRYIAIEIAVKDLHEWENGSYPHKIAFRKCKVLFECDRFGKGLTQ